MKKSKFVVTILFFIIMINTIVNASELKVINSNSDYSIENENIKFTKKIINCDSIKQEVEIELCIENIKKDDEEIEDVEIVLILDNSASMNKNVADTTRKNITYKATNKLINSIYDNIKGVKLCIMQYSSKCEMLTSLTDSKDTALNALEKYNKTECANNTNTDDALNLAKSKFSQSCKNKILVLLTDGYPSDPENTKKILQELKNTNINLLSTIICDGNNTKQIEGVFGTEENPTAGKVYYVEKDSEIDRILNELLYMQIINCIKHPIRNIEIKDIFPDHIIKYFDIKYSDLPSKGVATSIDKDYFTWTINKLEGEEKAYFKYKLILKKDVDITPIVDKELPTNASVSVKYEDKDNTKVNENLEKNPIIKIKDMITISSTVEDNDTIDKNVIISENQDNNETQQEKVVIVDVSSENQESNNKEEKNVEIKTQQTQKTNSIKEEKLPQTGDREVVIAISVIISIILAIKLKLSTKNIYIVKK